MLRPTSQHASDIAAEAQDKVRNALNVVDQAVSDRDFLLGSEFSAADVMMGYSLQLLRNFRILDDRCLRAQAYLVRLRSRDAFERARKA